MAWPVRKPVCSAVSVASPVTVYPDHRTDGVDARGSQWGSSLSVMYQGQPQTDAKATQNYATP